LDYFVLKVDDGKKILTLLSPAFAFAAFAHWKIKKLKYPKDYRKHKLKGLIMLIKRKLFSLKKNGNHKIKKIHIGRPIKKQLKKYKMIIITYINIVEKNCSRLICFIYNQKKLGKYSWSKEA
jgi:hypothetical protein